MKSYNKKYVPEKNERVFSLLMTLIKQKEPNSIHLTIFFIIILMTEKNIMMLQIMAHWNEMLWVEIFYSIEKLFQKKYHQVYLLPRKIFHMKHDSAT
jgi:hypothetical protein